VSAHLSSTGGSRGDANPPTVATDEVWAEDDARVVVLESLARVDAADLVLSSLVGSPELLHGATTVPSTFTVLRAFHGLCQFFRRPSESVQSMETSLFKRPLFGHFQQNPAAILAVSPLLLCAATPVRKIFRILGEAHVVGQGGSRTPFGEK
jgi:hypothetical protein